MADEASYTTPLLGALGCTAPAFGVWKNVEAGLSGDGDLDCVAPCRQWPQIAAAHRAWAQENGLGPPLVCRHFPGLMVLVAFSVARPEHLLQVDVLGHIFVAGAPLVAAGELAPLLEADPRGFRRLRPGAGGLLELLQDVPWWGVRWPARPPDRGALTRLAEDPEGMQRAAALLGSAAPVALRVAETAAGDGEWDRQACARLSALCLTRSLRRPRIPTGRVLAGLGAGGRCPLMRALAAGRRVPSDRRRWLADVISIHGAA